MDIGIGLIIETREGEDHEIHVQGAIGILQGAWNAPVKLLKFLPIGRRIFNLNYYNISINNFNNFPLHHFFQFPTILSPNQERFVDMKFDVPPNILTSDGNLRIGKLCIQDKVVDDISIF
ncbi:MAG: hypothetical protein ACTSUE_20785, partial [Promethearchaeota archaeon]